MSEPCKHERVTAEHDDLVKSLITAVKAEVLAESTVGHIKAICRHYDTEGLDVPVCVLRSAMEA